MGHSRCDPAVVSFRRNESDVCLRGLLKAPSVVSLCLRSSNTGRFSEPVSVCGDKILFFFLKKGTNFFLSSVPVVVNNVYANISSGVSDNKEVETVFDTGINMVWLL